MMHRFLVRLLIRLLTPKDPTPRDCPACGGSCRPSDIRIEGE